MVTIPEVDGDPHTGLDDALAHGHDPIALAHAARPFVPVDVGRERLNKNEKLRRGVSDLRLEIDRLPARKVGECSAVAVARYMVENSAPAHGKPQDRGIKVHPSHRQIAAGVRISVRTVGKAIDRLEAIGFLEPVDESRRKNEAASYLLLYPSGGGAR